jgi:sRNA-binding regulator protein Hfq
MTAQKTGSIPCVRSYERTYRRKSGSIEKADFRSRCILLVMAPINQFGRGEGGELLTGRRRGLPTESTRRESEYIDWLSKNRIPVVVKLVDDEEVRGWIEYYDRYIVRLTRDKDANLFIYKKRIKYLYEEPANRRRRGQPDKA